MTHDELLSLGPYGHGMKKPKCAQIEEAAKAALDRTERLFRARTIYAAYSNQSRDSRPWECLSDGEQAGFAQILKQFIEPLEEKEDE